MKSFDIKTNLNVQWHFRKPDGEAFSLEGLKYTLKYRTGRGESLAKGVLLTGPDKNILSWVFPAEEQNFTGVYDLTLDLYQPGDDGWKKLCSASFPGAFSLDKKLLDCRCKKDQYLSLSNGYLDENPDVEIVTLHSTAEWWLYTPVTPVAGTDGYWYINGARAMDGNGNYVPTKYDLEWDEEEKVFTITEGNGGEAIIISTVYAIKNALDDMEAAYNQAEQERQATFAATETIRMQAENQRKTAEDLRKSAELTRQQNEADRARAEGLRNSSEEERQSYEANRISNEANREEAEAIRRYNETQREQDFESIIVEGIGKLNDLGGKVDTLTTQMPTKADNTRVGMLESRLNSVQTTASQAKSQAEQAFTWQQQNSFRLNNITRTGNTTSLDGVEIVPTLNKKNPLLVQGSNITLTDNADGTQTISATGGGGGSVNVVDNLDSESSTDALSARQGKILGTSVQAQSETITSLVEWLQSTDERLDSYGEAIQSNIDSLSDLNGNIGNPEELTTTAKNSLVAAVNEMNGKLNELYEDYTTANSLL